MKFKLLLFLSFLIFGFYYSKNFQQYVVEKGDSYYLIGKKFQINYLDIIKLNKGKKLIAGATIKIPFYFFHKVKTDESLSFLAQKYLVTVDDIVRLNDLKNTYLYVGQTLKIPKFVSEFKATELEKNDDNFNHNQTNNYLQDNLSFVWPVSGTIKVNSKEFDDNMNLGIFIKTLNNDTVYASEDGVVIYQGEIRGFGKTTFVAHGNSLISAYMGIKEYFVNQNQVVQKGQPIAKTKREIFFSIFLRGDPQYPGEYFKNSTL